MSDQTITPAVPDAPHDRTVYLLTQLGDTKQAVADKLLELGHLGEPQSTHSCPVANYLKAADLGAFDVEIEGSEVSLYFFVAGVDDYCDDTNIITIDIPNPVCDFVTGFDVGEFPKLVKQPAVTA